jgi:hypothetical protein
MFVPSGCTQHFSHAGRSSSGPSGNPDSPSRRCFLSMRGKPKFTAQSQHELYVLQGRSQATPSLGCSRRGSRCSRSHPGSVHSLVTLCTALRNALALKGRRKLVDSARKRQRAGGSECLGLRRVLRMGLNGIHIVDKRSQTCFHVGAQVEMKSAVSADVRSVKERLRCAKCRR